MARLPYAEPAGATDEVKALFDRVAGERESGRVLGLYRMLANSPDFARAWLDLGTACRRGKLDPKLRELALLEVGRLTKASYEWLFHVQVARKVGVTAEQIEALLSGKTDGLFDEREQLVIAYARAMTQDLQVPDEVFEPLRRFFDVQTIVELTITIGFYNMVCRFLLALEIDLDPTWPPSPWE